MNEIDFLPPIYLEQAKNRGSGLWRLGVIVLVGGLVGIAAIGQYGYRRAAEARLAEIELDYQEILKTDADLALTKKSLATVSDKCALRVYLGHPWPKSVTMLRVLDALPETVALTEVKCQMLAPSSSSGLETVIRPRGEAEVTTQLPDAVADLKQLREKYDRHLTVIMLNGSAAEIGHVRAYSRRLEKLDLVQSVKIKTMNSIQKRDQPTLTGFEIEVVLIPGYGQTGGPAVTHLPSDSAGKGGAA